MNESESDEDRNEEEPVAGVGDPQDWVPEDNMLPDEGECSDDEEDWAMEVYVFLILQLRTSQK